MDFISSDTSVWVDFSIIGRIDLPFCLPYTYIMNTDAIEDEILSPTGLRDKLLHCGLVGVELTAREFFLAENFGHYYPRLSKYDRIALAIAAERRIILLTGDGALRSAAKIENVSVIGTLGILDQLRKGDYVTDQEYESCLLELQRHNGLEVRLPKSEISIRLHRLKSNQSDA